MDIQLVRYNEYAGMDLVVNRAGGFSQDFELVVGPVIVRLSRRELNSFLYETLSNLPSFKVSDSAWEEVADALHS